MLFSNSQPGCDVTSERGLWEPSIVRQGTGKELARIIKCNKCSFDGCPHLQVTETIVAHLVHQAVEQNLRSARVHTELALRGEIVGLLQ